MLEKSSSQTQDNDQFLYDAIFYLINPRNSSHGS